MRCILTVAFLFACLAPAPAGAASPGDDLGGMGWLPSDVYDTNEGLPDPTVNAIAALPDGQVWLGTMHGLARLHGARVVAEPGPAGSGHAVLSLAATADGDLLASLDGDGVYRLHHGQWRSLGRPFGGERTQRLRAIDAGGTTRIFATGAGVAEWAGDRWRALALPDALAGRDIFDIALEPAADGRAEILWLASFGAGLYRCDGDAPCAPVAIAAPGPRSEEIRSLQLQPRPGRPPALWLALQGGGVARLQDGAWTRWHRGNSSLPSDFVSDIALVDLPDGRFEAWAGTRSGLSRLRGDAWTPADPRIPQLHERVRALAATRTSQGIPTMWMGTDSGAVRTPLDGPWRLVSTLGRRGNGIWDLLVEPAPGGGQRIWLASDGEGLGRYERGGWRHYRAGDGLPNDNLRSVARASDGSLWVGSWGGRVARMQGDRFVELHTPWDKSPSDAASILLADRGEVWVGTREQGVARWDGRGWHWFRPGPAMPGWVYAAVRIGDAVWFSAGKSLLRHRDGQWRVFGKDIGLPDDRFYDLRLIPDAGGRPVLWLGSSGNGLLRVDVSDPDRPRRVDTPKLPALPLPKVYGAVRDGRGDVLVCTDYGVFGWRLRDGAYASTAYHRADGLPHDECNGGALQVDDRGRVWIGTVGGAAVYTPPPEAPRRPSPLLLTALRVDGHPVAFNKTRLALPRPDSSLELHYDLLTGEQEAGNSFRVKVVGEDDPANGWQAADNHVFSRLPEGRQRIRIEARDHAGVAAVPLEFEVDVPQAWWRTPLARALLVLAALLLFWGVLKLRERQLHQREERLRAMVGERTAQLQASDAELRRANDELRRLSYTDPLTGLGNRRRLFESMELYCRAGAGERRPLGVLLLDLDHFKAYNDSHGHMAGDACLQDIARLLQAELPPGALAARYGGEEFCVLLPGMDEDAAAGVAEGLRAAIRAMPGNDCAGASAAGAVTASIGVAAAVPGGPRDAEALLSRADRALYRAKAAGRDRVERAGG